MASLSHPYVNSVPSAEALTLSWSRRSFVGVGMLLTSLLCQGLAAACVIHVPLDSAFNLRTMSRVSVFPGTVCSNPRRINLSALVVSFFSCWKTGCFAQMFMIPMFFHYRCCFPAPVS